MITLLASIVGFISSTIPEILKIFKDRSDKSHELNVLNKRLELLAIEPEKKDQYIENFKHETSILYSTYNTGVSWVDALNGTVRPLLAYSFFVIYTLTKYMQYRMIEANGLSVAHLDVMWSLNDQAIFASITSFYFGQRTFNKIWKRIS